MSPLNVRRYRAERLLRGEFEALRGSVVAAVRARLRGSGVTLDQSDLDACYASAWQGLYMAVLDGQEIENPAGWLVLVTFRRAVDEHRARMRVHRGADLQPFGAEAAHTSAGVEWELAGAREPDLAGDLDDRARLRQLFEGLRGRLNAREREAAVLCYLQGLTRAQAAERMGVSEARMRKLMEGSGIGRPGVAGKVGALVQTIRDGGWCEEQGSLMRALAFGILDPDGERYQLALLHRGECPSCRAYVTSLRGLAATLPPVFVPWGIGAAVLARVGGAHVGAGAAAGGGAGAAGGVSTGGLGAGGGGSSAGALSASGAAGVGAGASGVAGGGWLFAGGAKLAAGCVLALSVGAGCVALNVGGPRSHPPVHRHRAARAASAIGSDSAIGAHATDLAASQSGSTGAHAATAALTPAGKASREFGPERALAAAARRPAASAGHSAPAAHAASSSFATGEATVRSSAAAASRPPQTSTSSGGGASAAEREFSPG
jgi:DNA-directed RNA polymerase specialized sigma24 family protein